MWSVYVLICFLCIKSHMGYPQYELENSRSHVSEKVRRQLSPQDNLDTEVDTSRLSADAKNIASDMANGIGGTTIATYDGKTRRTFIFKNRTRSICKGTLKGTECDGTVEPFTITTNDDYCYATSHAVINNDICLSSRSVRLVFKNSKFECTSGDDTPTLVLTRQQYYDLCKDVTSRQVVYKYYASANDPAAIPIPNSNPFVKCLNNEPGVCEFKEDKTIIPFTDIISTGTNNGNSNGSTTVASKNDVNSTDRKESNTNGCNTVLQRIEIILFAISVGLVFHY